MPIYEYRCQQCGSEFERIQKISDEPPSACPECGGPVSKLISLSGFQLKGSGWYLTDYARKGAESVAKDKKSKPAAKDDSSGSSTESSGSSTPASSESTSSSSSKAG